MSSVNYVFKTITSKKGSYAIKVEMVQNESKNFDYNVILYEPKKEEEFDSKTGKYNSYVNISSPGVLAYYEVSYDDYRLEYEFDVVKMLKELVKHYEKHVIKVRDEILEWGDGGRALVLYE